MKQEQWEGIKLQCCFWVRFLKHYRLGSDTHRGHVHKQKSIKGYSAPKDTMKLMIYKQIYAYKTEWIHGSIKYRMISLLEIECDLRDSEERKSRRRERKWKSEKKWEKKWFQRSGNITPIAAKSRDWDMSNQLLMWRYCNISTTCSKLTPISQSNVRYSQHPCQTWWHSFWQCHFYKYGFQSVGLSRMTGALTA